MSDNQIPAEGFRGALLALLDETFTQTIGVYLDRGTTMFETLDTISAEEASASCGDGCGTLAAQVKHTTYYLDVMNQEARGEGTGSYDWPGSWAIAEVTPAEWDAEVSNLRRAYDELRAFASTNQRWDENFVGGAFAIVAHSAFHLGQIRQSLCWLKGNRTDTA